MSLPDFYALDAGVQDDILGGWEAAQGRCATHNGPREECADPEKVWYPQRAICHAAMEEEAAKRRYEQLHEALPYHDGTFSSWAKESSTSHPYRYSDGVRIWVAPDDLTPDDKFLSMSGGDPDGSEAGEGRPRPR